MNKIYEEGYIQDIADAIRTKNGTQDTYTVSQMATAIENIPSGVGTIEINDNGIYDVSQYAEADVLVPRPYGDIQITTNGTHDVADYENAIVNVSVPEPTNEIILGSITNMQSLANARGDIVEINKLDCSYIQNNDLSASFSNFQACKKISLINTSSIINMMNCFNSCILVETIDLGTPSSCTSYNSAFSSCASLVDIIGLDLSNITQENGIYSMVYGCSSLSDDTLNDIMSEVASMQNYTGNKWFRNILGIDSTITDARLQSLSAYPDLINAGWTL